MKEFLDPLWWHFREWKGLYLGLFLFAATIALFQLGVGNLESRIKERRLVVQEWPLVEAVVMGSKIVFRDKSSMSGFGGDYHAKLLVRYQFEGRRIETETRGQWESSELTKRKKMMLAVGSVVPLRVDPQTPDFASLIELTGDP